MQDIPRNDNEAYALRYTDFIMPMIKGMQEQQQIIEDQKKIVEEQKVMIEELKKSNLEVLQRINALEQRYASE